MDLFGYPVVDLLVKCTVQQAMQAQRGNRSIQLPLL